MGSVQWASQPVRPYLALYPQFFRSVIQSDPSTRRRFRTALAWPSSSRHQGLAMPLRLAVASCSRLSPTPRHLSRCGQRQISDRGGACPTDQPRQASGTGRARQSRTGSHRRAPVADHQPSHADGPSGTKAQGGSELAYRN